MFESNSKEEEELAINLVYCNWQSSVGFDLAYPPPLLVQALMPLMQSTLRPLRHGIMLVFAMMGVSFLESLAWDL